VLQLFAVGWLVLTGLSALRYGVSWNYSYIADALPTSLFSIAPFGFLVAFFLKWWRTRTTA
jgi:hypothetical protein